MAVTAGTQVRTGKVSMLYDGGCPLCSKEVAHYKKVDRAGRVNWVDITADTMFLDELDIGLEAAMKHLHVVGEDGSVQRGAYAFAAVWKELPYYRWLAKLVSIPGVLSLLDLVYGKFAVWRFNRRKDCVRCG